MLFFPFHHVFIFVYRNRSDLFQVDFAHLCILCIYCLCALSLRRSHVASNRTKPNKRGRNQAEPKPNKTKTERTRTKPNCTQPNQTQPKTRLNQARPNKTKPNHTKPCQPACSVSGKSEARRLLAHTLTAAAVAVVAVASWRQCDGGVALLPTLLCLAPAATGCSRLSDLMSRFYFISQNSPTPTN